MNIFTTEHPLTIETPRFSEKYPVLALFRNAFVFALIIMPGMFVVLYEFAIRDIGAEPTPFPEPWLALIIGLAFAFVLSVVPAVMILVVFRLLSRNFRQLCGR